jgi:hypothetical protein
MPEEPKALRIATLVVAAALSIPVSVIGIMFLPFIDETQGPYEQIIKWGFMAAVSMLPAFAIVVFSLRLLAWYLRAATLLIYAGEFFIIWEDCVRVHGGWTGWVPVNVLVSAFGAFVAPQVFLAITVVVLVEYLLRWERVHLTDWNCEL